MEERLELNDASLFLDWEDVDGADSYVVQIWDRVAGFVFDWKDLPVSGFSLNGSSSSQTLTKSEAMAGNLNFDHTYDFRLMSVVNGERSDPGDQRIKIDTAPPFYGRQEDHTVQYRMGTSAPRRDSTDPTLYSPHIAIPSGIEEGISDWNGSAVKTGTPNLLICEKGENCPSNRPDDGRVVTVSVGNGGSCDKATACFKPSSDFVTDSKGYIYGGTIYIEEPAYEGYGIHKRRYLWTNNPKLQNQETKGRPGDRDPRWAYLPDTVMHEFGHTIGLYDFYKATTTVFGFIPQYWYKGYNNSVMWSDVSRSLQHVWTDDIDYVREVYRHHAAK